MSIKLWGGGCCNRELRNIGQVQSTRIKLTGSSPEKHLVIYMPYMQKKKKKLSN